jgi:PTS system nitrogen regulatory IIA component
MKIKDFLYPTSVVIDLAAADKARVLGELARRAAQALGLSTDAVEEAVEKRDELGSTGIGGGVAIPHARLREIKYTYGMLARLKNPIDFEAIDGEPVDIVFLLLLPASSQLDQLNALAEVARKLRDENVMRKLRAAKTAPELYEVISRC